MVKNVSCKSSLLSHRFWETFLELWTSFHFVFEAVALLRHDLFGLFLKRQAQSSIVNHSFLLLFKHENKKELREEFNSQWNSLRDSNWQHSKTYIMPQPTDLFCHAIILAKFNMLCFNLHLPANIEGSHIPTWLSSGARA